MIWKYVHAPLFFWFEVTFHHFHSHHFSQIFPSTIPDLCYDRPLIISGRYKGNFPDKLEAKGTLADMSNFIIDIEVQHTQDIPLEKVSTFMLID